MNNKIHFSRKTVHLTGTQEATFLIRVSPGLEGDIQGKIEHIGSGQYQEFQSYGQMIQLINRTLEETGLPMSDSILRKW
ncbi:hypothetical protein LPY66_07255 [Dehalobacter sp. DCM]|uniref:hypothetical protein n=1 Tax=Dehalobacter sp. DCM TaxID=2907827 RepID=UPI003081D140|nr:hypothetical protein LPY66_07255 [Dehalobacter sp. DCM]